MKPVCTIAINNETFAAYPGDRILDAALVSGVELPHDCRAGACGTCVVRVLEGHVLGGESRTPGMVHACQAVVLSSLRLAVDALPPPAMSSATLLAATLCAPDVAELTVEPAQPFAWLPGQYVKLRFEGLPARSFSPTVALDGRDQPGTLRFHIKRLPDGRVSAEIGRTIKPGCRLTIEGPYGSAYFRPGYSDRLVLFSGGTGFAPVWAIADAALRENAARAIVVVVGVASLPSLYMATALERMSACRNVSIVAVSAEPQFVAPRVRTGWPTDFGSIIAAGDCVHAAGAPDMVETLSRYAAAAGVTFHADPFEPSTATDSTWLSWAMQRLGAPARNGQPQPAFAHGAAVQPRR
jgi:NAD(P)H-flavin reductase